MPRAWSCSGRVPFPPPSQLFSSVHPSLLSGEDLREGARVHQNRRTKGVIRCLFKQRNKQPNKQQIIAVVHDRDTLGDVSRPVAHLVGDKAWFLTSVHMLSLNELWSLQESGQHPGQCAWSSLQSCLTFMFKPRGMVTDPSWNSCLFFLAPCAGALSGAQALRVSEDTIFVFGGVSIGKYRNSICSFNTSLLEVWMALASLPWCESLCAYFPISVSLSLPLSLSLSGSACMLVDIPSLMVYACCRLFVNIFPWPGLSCSECARLDSLCACTHVYVSLLVHVCSVGIPASISVGACGPSDEYGCLGSCALVWACTWLCFEVVYVNVRVLVCLCMCTRLSGS